MWAISHLAIWRKPLAVLPQFALKLQEKLGWSGDVPLSQILAISYEPRYKPLPRAVHVPRSIAPRKMPRTPSFRTILLVISHVVSGADELPALSIILVLTTSNGVVSNAARLPETAALAPVTKPVSTRADLRPFWRVSFDCLVSCSWSLSA